MKKNSQSVVIRTDASLIIGSGHVMRCLTLASALREKGATVTFVCREHNGHFCDLIADRGFPVSRLVTLGPPRQSTEEAAPAHAAWLGATWREDADETRIAIEALGIKPDWLVVDHYALDSRWETALRPSVGRIMVVDDLADRPHDCELLLDQNLVAEMHTRYAGKVPAACGLLLGPEYALLQPIHAELHDRIPPREGQIQRIFVSFGGADGDNLTGRTLAAFLRMNRPDIKVDVVITAGSPHEAAIRQQVEGHGNIHLHSGLPTLAPLMARADLAIGAGGAMSWERLCLGLPTLVVTLAENQRPIADGLSQHGLIRWLGHQDMVDESAIAQALSNLLQQSLHEDWSLRCFATVDGKGVNRVSAALTVTATTSLRARAARLEDEAMSLEWANDPTTRRNAFSPEPISAETHRNWFRARLRDLESCHLYLVEAEESVPVGQVRFDRGDQTWEIDYALAPHYRGRNLDRPLVEVALLKLREDEPGVLVLGQVKESNQPSCLVFESLSFDAQTNGGRWNIGVCSDARSWINAAIPEHLLSWLAAGHQVSWAHDAAALPAGDICFYLSYGRIVGPELLARYRNNLVVHESDLPKGRSWSPLTWQVLEGADSICVTLFEAADAVDSGPIYLQEKIELRGDELVDDLHRLQGEATFRLCRSFVAEYPGVLNKARAQTGDATYYRRRHPIDSQLDPDQTLRAQFNLLRVSDNQHYPAWFEIGSVKYTLKIEKH